jgi:hypothetical protein
MLTDTLNNFERKLSAKSNAVNKNEGSLLRMVFIFLFQILRFRFELNLSREFAPVSK